MNRHILRKAVRDNRAKSNKKLDINQPCWLCGTCTKYSLLSSQFRSLLGCVPISWDVTPIIRTSVSHIMLWNATFTITNLHLKHAESARLIILKGYALHIATIRATVLMWSYIMGAIILACMPPMWMINPSLEPSTASSRIRLVKKWHCSSWRLARKNVWMFRLAWTRGYQGSYFCRSAVLSCWLGWFISSWGNGRNLIGWLQLLLNLERRQHLRCVTSTTYSTVWIWGREVTSTVLRGAAAARSE